MRFSGGNKSSLQHRNANEFPRYITYILYQACANELRGLKGLPVVAGVDANCRRQLLAMSTLALALAMDATRNIIVQKVVGCCVVAVVPLMTKHRQRPSFAIGMIL